MQYSADNNDKAWLIQRGLMTRAAGKAYLLIADDIAQVAEGCARAYHRTHTDAHRCDTSTMHKYTFTLPDDMLDKVRMSMQTVWQSGLANNAIDTIDARQIL
jgi:hypothetical protein